MLNVIRGLPVEIEMQNEEYKGRVFNVFRDGNHRLCFGIAWTEDDVPGNRMLLNTYVKNGNDFFVCNFLELRGDNVLISLSGEQLEVPRSWIQSITQGQREVQLQDMQTRNILEKVYQMPARPTIQRILDFEYQIPSGRVVKQSTWVGETAVQTQS